MFMYYTSIEVGRTVGMVASVSIRRMCDLKMRWLQM
jgi:hypothetical protein